MLDETEVHPVIDGKPRSRSVDRAIAALADEQHGIVTRTQLVALGIGHKAIDHRLRCGRLHSVHRGVFSVGHRARGAEATWLAAVLALGPDAVLSHRSAAALWGMRPTARERVDVAAPRKLPSRPAIQVHQLRLAADEVTTERGIPVTTPMRTLLDLAAVIGRHRLERAVAEAERLRLRDALSLADLLERHAGHRGVASLRRVLASAVPITVTRSEFEERFLAFLDDAGLPLPETNVPIELRRGGWIEADCLWRPWRLMVELDGYQSHGTRRAFEHDRRRDRALQAAGWRVLRVTWRQLQDEPERLAGDLRPLLGR